MKDNLKDGLIDLTAGTAGGIVNVLVGQSLDTVTLKMQTFPSLYKNWVHCFGETYRLDGIRGLYSGAVPSLIANVAENTILFTAYGYCQKCIAFMSGIEKTEEMPSMLNALSGSIASFFSSLVLCPIELVKCRIQARQDLDPKARVTPFKVCAYILKKEGISIFGTGMTATLARDVPGYSCFFGAYETTRYMLSKKRQRKDDIGLARTMFSGAVGGLAFCTVTFPADVIKSRIQVRGITLKQLTLEIIKKNGFKEFYKGFMPTLIRTCIVSSCLFATYENTKYLLRKYTK